MGNACCSENSSEKKKEILPFEATPLHNNFEKPNNDFLSSLHKINDASFTYAPSSSIAIHTEEKIFMHPKVKEIKNKLPPFLFLNNAIEDDITPILGPMKFAETQEMYEGQWENGVRHGRGVNYWPDGSIYEGYWRNGAAEGKGKIILFCFFFINI